MGGCIQNSKNLNAKNGEVESFVRGEEKMRSVIHGGDIYQNEIELDFSVNINPFGIPEKVKEAMQESLELCEHYPDIHHAKPEHTITFQRNIFCVETVHLNCLWQSFMQPNREKL